MFCCFRSKTPSMFLTMIESYSSDINIIVMLTQAVILRRAQYFKSFYFYAPNIAWISRLFATVWLTSRQLLASIKSRLCSPFISMLFLIIVFHSSITRKADLFCPKQVCVDGYACMIIIFKLWGALWFIPTFILDDKTYLETQTLWLEFMRHTGPGHFTALYLRVITD